MLERRTTPEARARAPWRRCATPGVDDLSLDLIFGVPGETRALLDARPRRPLALEPDHLSCYELEAKPGTRFTHRHGRALAAQAELLEDHLERVVDRLEAAGYRWYETASFARAGPRGTAQHRLLAGARLPRPRRRRGRRTVDGVRRRTRPRLAPYLGAAAGGAAPPQRHGAARRRARAPCERLMLGLRLAVGVERAAVEDVLDGRGVGPARRRGPACGEGAVRIY